MTLGRESTDGIRGLLAKNRIGTEGAVAIAKSLETNYQSLQRLYLDISNIVGVKVLRLLPRL